MAGLQRFHVEADTAVPCGEHQVQVEGSSSTPRSPTRTTSSDPRNASGSRWRSSGQAPTTRARTSPPRAAIVGTPGNDTLRGTEGPDAVGGDDTLLGNFGDDTLPGGVVVEQPAEVHGLTSYQAIY